MRTNTEIVFKFLAFACSPRGAKQIPDLTEPRAARLRFHPDRGRNQIVTDRAPWLKPRPSSETRMRRLRATRAKAARSMDSTCAGGLSHSRECSVDLWRETRTRSWIEMRSRSSNILSSTFARAGSTTLLAIL
jgi:hypothetical protein